MGSDSRATSGWEGRTTSIQKVFRKDDFLIGICGEPRMGQLLQYKLKVEPRKDEPEEQYIVCTLMDSVRQCFKEGGFSKIEHNVEEGGNFLVGYHGKLYEVDSNFQICEHADKYEAIGSGREYALGAMRVLPNLPPEKRIRKALEASAYFNIGVAPPFKVMKI